VDTTNISTYQYGVNSLGQRTNVAQTGSAFSGVRDITWGYDSLGQVTKADHTIPGLGRAYVFDGIGNRLKAAEGTTDPEDPTATAYTPTALNQYDAIGTLNPDHDPDGNMTSGPLPANLSANSTLGWDAENRLVSASVPGGDTVTFFYDARSRRIAEKVGATTKITIYDGWNPIAEYLISNSQYQISKSYLWGMDLSGTLQGAGGVGGLLMVSEISNSQISNYYPTYDGNGNVSEYLNSSGTVVAHYEYDPFGKTTVATGPKANDFAHRFSTKPLDAATGLYYYGYRFYDPNTGRWPSRDPIGEKGGRNLYVMASNDTISLIDVLGLEETTYRDCNIKVFWGHSTASEQALMQENDKDGEKGCTAAGALGCSLNGTNNPARGRFGIFKNTWKTIPNFPNCASGRIGTRDHWDYHHRENTNGGYNPADTNRKSTDLEERTAAGFTMLAAMAWKAALEHSKEMCSYRCFPCICKQVTVEFICSSEDRTDEDLNERYNIGLKSGYLPANFDDGKLIKFELDPNNDYLEGYTTIGEGARKLPLCGEKLVLECLRNY
jgi:RHS repeat-associated protein